jgi:hypothetical protein
MGHLPHRAALCDSLNLFHYFLPLGLCTSYVNRLKMFFFVYTGV